MFSVDVQQDVAHALRPRPASWKFQGPLPPSLAYGPDGAKNSGGL